MSRCICRLLAAAILLVTLLRTYPQISRGSDGDAPDIMPPHPGLWQRAQRGEIVLPQSQFVAGLDSPDDATRSRAPAAGMATLGTLRTLAVLVDFSDKVHTTKATFYDSLIFEAPKPGRGSVRDYYNEVTYGQVDIVSVNLPSSLGWQRAPLAYSDYVNGASCIPPGAVYPHNCQKLAEDIVDAVSGLVDFSNYDNNHDGATDAIMLIHAGPGAEYTGSNDDIWSHSWSLRYPRHYNNVTISKYVIMPEYWYSASATSSDMTIGVFAHELGHAFWNLRDLYDRDYSSYGIGTWSLMSSGAWNGPGYDGSSPAWPDAWSRLLMGIITPTVVLTNVVGQVIPEAYGNPAANTVYKLQTPALGAGEYFLVENRQRVPGSYDEYLPGSGLLIWHVDEAMDSSGVWNDKECQQTQCCSCSQAHYAVSLEQADGALQLEKHLNQGDASDPFPGNVNSHIFGAQYATGSGRNSWYSCNNTCVSVANISAPSANMTADLRITCLLIAPAVFVPLILNN